MPSQPSAQACFADRRRPTSQTLISYAVYAREEAMRRREFIALAGASAAWPFAAVAQEPGRIYRVGGISSGPRDAPAFVAMFDELRREVLSQAKT